MAPHGFGVWKGDRRTGPGVIDDQGIQFKSPIPERKEVGLWDLFGQIGEQRLKLDNSAWPRAK